MNCKLCCFFFGFSRFFFLDISAHSRKLAVFSKARVQLVEELHNKHL